MPVAPVKLNKAVADANMFVAVRNAKTKNIVSVNTVHDLNIGNSANVIITGETECRGAATFKNGASGVLNLPNGNKTINAGDNVIVTYNNNGTVTITASINAGSLQTQLDALESSLETLESTVSESSALVSTLDTRITSVSGSLVTLTNSHNALSDIVTILQNSSGLSAGLTLNETPSGVLNGVNRIFTLGQEPYPATSLMLFLNGQLLTAGANNDFVLSNSTITISSAINSPTTDDVLSAMYSYRTSVTSYSINEPLTIQNINSQHIIDILHTPNPVSSLMLFQNGQLLTAGAGNDYQLTDKRITMNEEIHDLSSSTFFATYSY